MRWRQIRIGDYSPTLGFFLSTRYFCAFSRIPQMWAGESNNTKPFYVTYEERRSPNQKQQQQQQQQQVLR